MKISSFIINNPNSFVSNQVSSRNALPLPPENPLNNFSGNPSKIYQHTSSAYPVSIYTPSGRGSEIGFWKAHTQNSSASCKENVNTSGQIEEAMEGIQTLEIGKIVFSG